MRDWVCTLPVLVAIGGSVLAFDPIVRVARLFGLRAMERKIQTMERIIVRAFRICAVRVVAERAPGVEADGAYIYIANHQSNFDIALLGALQEGHQPRFVAMQTLERWIPTISFVLRHGEHALVEPQKRRETLRSIRDMGRAAQAGRYSAVIFPEGTRSRTGELLDFQPAGTAMLLRAAPDLPVVPVTIEGAAELMKHALFPTPYGQVVRVRYSEPIPRSPDEDPDEVLAAARKEIESTLGAWRSGAA